jgi:hypothetical protein
LGDFRKGFLGYGSLEAPKSNKTINNNDNNNHDEKDNDNVRDDDFVVDNNNYNDDVYAAKAQKTNLDIGKGNYDGW